MLTTASGEPALVQRDPNFFGHASLKVAFGDASVHVPRYKPELESVVPYLSAFQPRFDVAIDPSDAREIGLPLV